jgi:hypothetical protein
MINLNDESYDSKPGVQIFNDGVPGIVENVTISIEKKKPEDKPNSPDYKVVFTDEKGGQTNLSFWYVTQANEWKTLEELVKAQAKSMKHILHALLGKETQLPSFNNATEMLNGCMKMIHDGAKNGVKFRVYTNYGTTQSPKAYLQVRAWVPFMQSMSDTEEVLKASNIENMVRLSADGSTSATSGTAAAAVADDWD